MLIGMERGRRCLYVAGVLCRRSWRKGGAVDALKSWQEHLCPCRLVPIQPRRTDKECAIKLIQSSSPEPLELASPSLRYCSQNSRCAGSFTARFRLGVQVTNRKGEILLASLFLTTIQTSVFNQCVIAECHRTQYYTLQPRFRLYVQSNIAIKRCAHPLLAYQS